MPLEDMTSAYGPGDTNPGNGLADGAGLADLTNAGSDLNVDENFTLTNGLAGGTGLADLTNAGSDLNIDTSLVPGTGLANGTGMMELGPDASNLDIDGPPNDMSDGLATGG